MTDYTETLQSAVAGIGITGASFAYWDGKVLHTAVAGLRNSVTGDPVTTDTVMHVGSITKVVNTALFMQLVDDGLIALDDPVLRHLPDFRLRDRDALRRLTCAMLVNHTSGIDCDWLPEYGPDKERIVDSVTRCADLEQMFQPGEATGYCNMATVVAGHLTQTLRDESWYTLVRKRIYEPLGLDHALVDPLEVPRFRASIGDLTDPKTGKLVQTTRPFLAPSFAPAGSTQMMTASDLVTFARALINGGVGVNGARILSAESAARMMKPTAQFFHPVGTDVGLGWFIEPGNVLFHGGGGPGVHSLLFAHPQSGRAVALLTNCDRSTPIRGAVLDPILESWTGRKPVVRPRLTAPVDLDPYVGTYESNLRRVMVSAEDGHLALRDCARILDLYDNVTPEPSPPVTLFPLGDDMFATEGAGMECKFVRPDADGKMRFYASRWRLLKRVE